MKNLAVDTSSSVCSVALFENDNLIVSKDSMNGGIDSAEIKALIDKFLL